MTDIKCVYYCVYLYIVSEDVTTPKAEVLEDTDTSQVEGQK